MPKTGYLQIRSSAALKKKIKDEAERADVSSGEWLRWAVNIALESGLEYSDYGPHRTLKGFRETKESPKEETIVGPGGPRFGSMGGY